MKTLTEPSIPCVFIGQTSGGQGIRTTCENTGKNSVSKVRGTNPTRNSHLPNIKACAGEALSELIELWPTLSPAVQNRIYAIAISEAGIPSQSKSKKEGAE